MSQYPELSQLHYSTWGIGFYTEHWLTKLNCWMYGMVKLIEKNMDLAAEPDVIQAFEKLCASDHMFVYDDPNQQSLARALFIAQYKAIAEQISFTYKQLATTFPIDPFQSIFLFVTTDKPSHEITFDISKLSAEGDEHLSEVCLETHHVEQAGVFIYFQYFMLQPATKYHFSVNGMECETRFQSPEFGVPIYIGNQLATRDKYNLEKVTGKLDEIWGKAVNLPEPSRNGRSSTPIYTLEELQRLTSKKRIAIYKYNKECYSLLRFQQLLSFDIVCVFDDSHSHADSGQVLLDKKNYIPVISDPSAIEQYDFDALIFTCGVNHESEITFFKRLIACASTRKIPVVSLYEDIVEYDSFLSERYDTKHFYKIGLKEDEHAQELDASERLAPENILAIFGTDSVQGKFTTQLYLREALRQHISVAHWSTEPTGTLLGADIGYSRYYGDLNDEGKKVLEQKLLQQLAAKHDLIITGGQNSIIFCLPGKRKENNASTHIFGQFLPRRIVLTVSVDTDSTDIQSSLDYVAALGEEAGIRSSVIALAMLTGRKVRGSRWTETSFLKVGSHIIDETKLTFERQFKLPVYIIPEQVDALAAIIVESLPR